MAHLSPVPESLMRYLRPVGMALLAMMFGFFLAVCVGFLVGPMERRELQYVATAFSVLAFVLLMQFSRRRRDRTAELERTGNAKPSSGANLLVTGLMAMALGALGMWIVFWPDTEERTRLIDYSLTFLGAGLTAATVGVKRLRDARARRASKKEELPEDRGSTAQPGGPLASHAHAARANEPQRAEGDDETDAATRSAR